MDLLPTTQKKKRCEFKPLKHSTLAQVQTLAAIFLCVLVMVAGWMHCGAWAERMSLECDAIVSAGAGAALRARRPPPALPRGHHVTR